MTDPILTEAQLRQLETGAAQLHIRRDTADRRLTGITRAIVASGEARLRAARTEEAGHDENERE